MNPSTADIKEDGGPIKNTVFHYICLEIINRVITKTGFASWLLYKAFKGLGFDSAGKQVIYEIVRGFFDQLTKVDFVLQQYKTINLQNMPLQLLNFLRFGTFLVMYFKINPKQVMGIARRQGEGFFAKYNRFIERVMNFVTRQSSQIIEEEIPKLSPNQRIAIQHSLPQWIVEFWANAYGNSFMEELCKASNERPPQHLRVNITKNSREHVQNALVRENIPVIKGSVAPHSLIVPNGIEVFKTKAFRKALFEMQDEGSQLATYLVDLIPGDTVLDYCAGKGSKTLNMASLAYEMNPRALIYASDVSERKLTILSRRVKRSFVDWSFVNIIQQADLPEIVKKISFSKILVDAPCSGLGTLRRKPWIKATCTQEDIAQLVEKQAMILNEVLKLVEPPARIIYITCTINPRENEEQILNFAKKHPDLAILPYRTTLSPNNPILTTSIPTASRIDDRFFSLYPPLTNTEGFFGAILEKRGKK